jgi:FHA domain
LVDQLLLALKIAFVVVLYLFIWRVIRVASRDMQAGQESAILTPVRPGPTAPPRPIGRLVVARSPELDVGSRIPISHELMAGRGTGIDIALEADGYASARHCKFIRGRDVDLIEDLHSTNGTFVNGERLNGTHQLAQGDTITIGQTQFEYEQGAA